jgi:hypothetical protein
MDWRELTGGSEALRTRPPRRRIFRGPRTVEAYLKASNPPPYMQRLRRIETEYRAELARLEAAYEALVDACGDDPDRFAHLWEAQASGWPFDELNDLIREHNRWYPIEAKLPMDPLTRDYVAVSGASYRRLELGPDWILEHFPAQPRREANRPRPPRRAPREHLARERSDSR